MASKTFWHSAGRLDLPYLSVLQRWAPLKRWEAYRAMLFDFHHPDVPSPWLLSNGMRKSVMNAKIWALKSETDGQVHRRRLFGTAFFLPSAGGGELGSPQSPPAPRHHSASQRLSRRPGSHHGLGCRLHRVISVGLGHVVGQDCQNCASTASSRN